MDEKDIEDVEKEDKQPDPARPAHPMARWLHDNRLPVPDESLTTDQGTTTGNDEAMDDDDGTRTEVLTPEDWGECAANAFVVSHQVPSESRPFLTAAFVHVFGKTETIGVLTNLQLVRAGVLPPILEALQKEEDLWEGDGNPVSKARSAVQNMVEGFAPSVRYEPSMVQLGEGPSDLKSHESVEIGADRA